MLQFQPVLNSTVTGDDFKHTGILLPQAAKSWDVKPESLCPDSSGISTYAYSSRAWTLRISILRYVTYDAPCHEIFFKKFILGKSEEKKNDLKNNHFRAFHYATSNNTTTMTTSKFIAPWR